MNANANIENRVIKTTAVSFLSTGLSIIIQLISVPICLRYWGKTMYGTWLAISAAFTMLRTIDGGYTSYIGNELNILYHKDQDYMKKIMASGVWGVAAIGLFQLLIVLFLYYFQSMGVLIGNTAGTTLTAKNAGLSLLIMIVTWTFVCSYTGILHRFLIPVGMLYQLLWWMLFLQLAQSFALILAAYMQVNVIMAAIFFAVSQAIVYLSSAIYIRCKLPKIYPWLKNTDMKIGLKEIFNSIPMTINGFVQQIGNSGLVVLISAILGAAMVPIYSTMRTLSNLWTTC